MADEDMPEFDLDDGSFDWLYVEDDFPLAVSPPSLALNAVHVESR